VTIHNAETPIPNTPIKNAPGRCNPEDDEQQPDAVPMPARIGTSSHETVINADENMPESRAVDPRAYCLEKFLLTRCHAPSRLVRVREELLSALKVEDVELWRDVRGCISSTALPAPPRPMW
jgi:hypothetical protein